MAGYLEVDPRGEKGKMVSPLDLRAIDAIQKGVDYDFSAQRASRRHTSAPRTPRKRLPFGAILAAALGLMVAVVLGVKTLADHLADSAFGEKPSPVSVAEPPQVQAIPAEPTPATPDPLSRPPQDVSIPIGVNTFLQAEYQKNAERCLSIESGLGLPLQADFSVVFCRPVWDFRRMNGEILWFYTYLAATMKNEPCVVFGVLDSEGASLFQHPQLQDDPLALLESRYQSVEWVALDQPHLSLIAAINGPWDECGATVDLFPLDGQPMIRIDDQDASDGPTSGDQWMAFHDADYDGYRDLCLLEITPSPNESFPQAQVRLYDRETGQFSAVWMALGPPSAEALQTAYEESQDSEKASPLGFLRPGRTLNVAGPAPEDVIIPLEDD